MHNVSDQSESTTLRENVSVLQRSPEEQAESQYATIQRQERTSNEFLTSYSQQRLWFFDQLEPDDTSYTMLLGLRLRGSVQHHLLKSSLQEIIRRHESLRTNFLTIDGEPRQVIWPERALSFPCIDLSGLEHEERESEAFRLATAEVQTPFNLEKGALLRGYFFVLTENESILLLNLHHIISDGWSLSVLQRELFTLYAAYAEGKASPLPELPIQYVDFANWQRERMESPAADEMVEYWKRHLDGLQLLELPTDRLRPPMQSYRGSIEVLELSQELTASLKNLSRREKISLFMLLLASFQLLLARYSGQDDIVVGTPLAGRTRVELENLIGYFVNPLVLRTDFSSNPTFRELLRRVRNVCLDAYAHQDLPFEKVLDALQPERDLSRSPLYQVVFSLQNTPQNSQTIHNTTFSPFYANYTVTKFDMTMVVEETADGRFKCVVDYSTDLFDAETIRQMLRHFRNLLTSAVANPQQPIASLSLLDPDERHQLISGWNATDRSWELDRCTHEIISDWATKTPDAIALVCEEESLSYGELEHRSNQLAHFLRQQGVGPETLVGIALERSVAMVVSILAIFKAGGAYLPLDLNYPMDRTAYMLEDSGVKILLSEETLLEQLPVETVRQTICLDRDWSLITEYSSEPPVSHVSGKNLALIIYTSGSTGRSKGVQIEHTGMLNHLYIKIEELNITAADKVAETASHCFVISVWQFLSALVQGGQVEIFKDEVTHDPATLLQQVIERNVTVLQVVPSLLHIMLDELDNTPVESRIPLRLNYMVATGEALPTDLSRNWLAHFPATPLMNAYGSTECSDDVAHITFTAEADIPQGRATAPIGHALGNMRIYVLDSQMQPVPVGVPGDLYIGGVGITRGYQDRPDLTADRFVPDPFSSQPGARLYRMGDRARYHRDGNLEYLGRVDHLVKLRGFRIELGEIESVLRGYPTVHEAVTQVREDIPGNKRLVAYLVAEPEQTIDIPAVRSYLKQQLPDYMVPASFVILESLPFTANGKLDRRALPAPEQGRADLAEMFVAPTTEPERLLAEVWCKVLGIEQVGIHDNFFEAGGDSLLGIRMIALAHKVGVHLTPKLLMQYQTISELLAVALDAPTNVVEQGPVTGTFPLVPMQGWALNHWPWKNPHRSNFAYMFLTRQRLNYPLFRQTIAHLAYHHDGLRLGLQKGEQGWQAFLPPPDETIPLTWIDLTALSEEDQSRAIEASADALQANMNLFTGQGGARIVYFDTGPERSGRFLILLHLLVADAYSLRIVLNDIQVVYGQLLRGQQVELPDKTTSLKQWAETLNEYVATPEMQEEAREYWLKQPWHRAARTLADFPENCGKATVGSIRKVFRALSPEDTSSLLEVMTPDTGILDILLAALTYTFGPRLHGQSLQLGVRELGRQTAFENIDPPANTVGRLSLDRLLLLHPAESGSLGDTLLTIKDQLAETPQRGIGHNLLAYLSKDPELVRALTQDIPQHEILVNHTGQMQQAFSLPEELGLFGGLAPENPGSTRDLDELLDFPFFLISSFGATQFTVLCEYSSDLYKQETVEGLIDRYLESIRGITHYLQGTMKA